MVKWLKWNIELRRRGVAKLQNELAHHWARRSVGFYDRE
jgi:hypothetical protein